MGRFVFQIITILCRKVILSQIYVLVTTATNHDEMQYDMMVPRTNFTDKTRIEMK